MTLSPGLHDVPPGHLAAVVTYLEMAAPKMPAKPFPDGIVATQEVLSIANYLTLYRAVGTPWLWCGRLTLSDTALAAAISDPATERWVIRKNGEAIGLVELAFSEDQECELVYFGLIPEATGSGLGGSMMALAQRQAFARPIKRFFVHTCNYDDPRALAFYQRAGFAPYKTVVEIYPDPRATGVLPKTAAPHIPCLT